MSQLVEYLGRFGIGIAELNVINVYNPELLYSYHSGFKNLTDTKSRIHVNIPLN